MAPKKPKDTTLDENYWRTCIEEAPLDEETWKVKVILIEAAGSEQDRIYLNKFEIFAAEERRFVIKNICKTETIFMVNQLGGEKKVKDDNLRVFEEGQAYLKDKKEIPSDILALIIKYLILKMKDEYLFIKRQKLEVREGMKKESATMINRAEVRGTVSVKPPEEPPVLPPTEKNKKDQSEALPTTPELTEGKKYNTLLRVRGEEWRDKIYVDDFPIDGPNLYVAITGFVEPFLAGCLIRIGIPLTAIVQIRIDPTSIRVPSSLFRTTKRGQSQTEILTLKCQKFWEDLQQLRIHNNTCDDYKNTAFIVFSPPYWDTESLSGSPENIYDELCYLMYDIQDLTRQHFHYLENMDVINIPQEIEENQSQNMYNQYMAELPLECVTIYSVVDSILQSVCRISQIEENSSKTSLSTALTINPTRQSIKDENKLLKAETLVKEVFKTLCNADSTKKKYRITYGEEYENHKDPIVINYGDLAKYSIFHLGNINMDNIVGSMLYGIPIFKLWQNQNRQSGELEAKINFHVNVLLSCFERKDVETVELNRLIHILACRKMYNNRSSLKVQHLPLSTLGEFKKVYLKRTVLAEPLPACSSLYRSWSSLSIPFESKIKNGSKSNDIDENSEDCRIKFLFDCPDISELVSAAEIASEKPISHMIDDFEFFEEYSSVSAFQTIAYAFNSFNCVDYKYCEVTDCLILMFYNNHDKDGVAREEWRCHLPTPLCLQDFFDFVLEEHYDWIKNEEELYEANTIQRTQSEYKNCFNRSADRTCLENTEVHMDLLMEGSLKYEELANVEEASPESTETKTKTTTMSPSTTDMASKSSKKTKSPVSTPKNVKQSVIEDESSTTNIPKKPFSGYNLSDRRVEIFGKDSCFFSKDGTNVLSKYSIMIPGNSEYIILKVAPGNDNTEFWMHKALGDVESHILDVCESFRISTKSNLNIYIEKQSYVVPLPTFDLSFTERPTEKERLAKSSAHNLSSSKLQILENKSFYSLNVTWPNGLITETVHKTNSANISHIKQHYITPMLNLDEDMRCISLNGEVIIFKTLGLIQIFRPDGSCIKITKCEKRINQDIIPEDLHSDTSSDKSKKGKGKEKNKPSKASSKSSKNVIDNDDKISDIKGPEYELFIDEFETIDADGLKQKWVNDMPIDTKKLLIRTATDYCSGEVFSRRMDGTSTLLNKDGIQIVTFPDNTRIITTFIIDEDEIYPEWTDEEIEYFAMFDSDIVENETIKSKSSSSQHSYAETFRQSNVPSVPSFEETEHHVEIKKQERKDGYISIQINFVIEHTNFATVTINKANGNISVTSPNNVNVTVSPDNNFDFTLDKATKAEFNGQDLNITYKACLQCDSNTFCKVKIKYDEIPSATNFHKCWLKMEDSFNKSITVNDEGNIKVIEDSVSDEVTYEEDLSNIDKNERKGRKVKSETSLGKCREVYEAKAMRFFVLRRELTCAELVHRALVDLYKQNCRWQPWCSINQYDTFGDNRSILSILTPIHLTETEKWLMESLFADKPKYLTYKDLKEDKGKGFYHWMRPYGRFKPVYRKPANVVPDRLPTAFVLRNLEQQWGEPKRDKLKGAKELLTAILRYRHLMESDSDTILYVPIRDLRPDDERRMDDIIQAIADRTYEDLKYRLAEDVQKRAKPSITTKPPIRPEEMSLEGELEEMPDEIAVLEEKQASVVKEVEAVEEMSPNLKRYWRRRAEEYKEEQFYKYLLREGSVPPYFRNVLGGAIWWEMNNITDEATTKAERRKMKCVCEEHGDDSSRGGVLDPPFTQ